MINVRIISPSGAIDPSFISAAAARLGTWGYRVSEGQYARAQVGRFAGTVEQRLSDLRQAWTDETVDVILCSRGGYGLQQMVQQLSTAKWLRDKCLVGFSDITILHQLCGLHDCPSLHASMCRDIASLPEDCPTLRLWRDAVEGRLNEYTLPAHPVNRKGEASGTLIGGNLSVLYGLQGTPWGLHALIDHLQCRGERPLLFIEDIGERHYHIDRMMLNLRLSGVLSRLAGLVVGQFSDCPSDEQMRCSVYDTIIHAVSDYDYPVLFDFPAGHVDDNRPLWLNRHATLSVTSTTSEINLNINNYAR